MMHHGAIGMARRKRLTTREPNGRIQREPEGLSPTEIHRLRNAAFRGLRDEHWGSELGRLFLERVLTREMHDAGKRWREEAAIYRQAIGAFPVRTASLERGRSMPADPDSEEGQKQASRETSAAERFFEAHAVLVAAGMGAENAVRRLCEDDEALAGLYDLKNARTGLTRLAEHYGLTQKGREPQNVR